MSQHLDSVLHCASRLEGWLEGRATLGWNEEERQKVAVVAALGDVAYADHPWETTLFAAQGWEYGWHELPPSAYTEGATVVPQSKHAMALQLLSGGVPRESAEYFVPTFFVSANLAKAASSHPAGLRASAQHALSVAMPGGQHMDYAIARPLALFVWAAILGSIARHDEHPEFHVLDDAKFHALQRSL